MPTKLYLKYSNIVFLIINCIKYLSEKLNDARIMSISFSFAWGDNISA